jgi:hypothetical protein
MAKLGQKHVAVVRIIIQTTIEIVARDGISNNPDYTRNRIQNPKITGRYTPP